MMKQKNPSKKNDIRDVTITDINNLGCGVGRIDGVVTFVAGACTGDELTVKLIKVASDYNVGKIEKIKKASPWRTDPACSAAKRCGGCVYRYITYEHELALKKGSVTASMKKAGLNLTVNDVLTTGVVDGYRNKAQYPVGQTKAGMTAIGFYAERSHEIIPCVTEDGSCRLQPENFGEIADFIRREMDARRIPAYDEISRQGIVRHLYMRRAESTGQVMLCVVAAREDAKAEALARDAAKAFPQIASLWLNINPDNTNVVLGRRWRLLDGSERITDSLCGRTFEISPQSFWQVNRAAAEMLYNKAAELAAIKPGERVLDLFCGIGSVGMSVCPAETRLYGIEIVPEAVENARRNAAKNGFADAEFLCLDAADPDKFGDDLRRIFAEGLDAVILDPPRKGCAPALLAMLAELAPARIVYISCNPDTLARDIAALSGAYRCDAVTPVDLFPRTGHCEAVCLLSKT